MPLVNPLVSALAVVLLCATASAQQLKPFAVDDLVRLARISEPELSPDGRQVVYSQRETDMDANKGRSDLWLLDLGTDGAQPIRLTRNEANDTSPRWSPDGKR